MFKAIKTGLLGELSIEVLDGIKEGETLITGPFKELRELKPGDLVREQKAERDRSTARLMWPSTSSSASPSSRFAPTSSGAS